jgi:hypothetical protein
MTAPPEPDAPHAAHQGAQVLREFAVATGPDHYLRAEELLACDGPLTGEMLATAQVHAMLAPAAATALADGSRIEADAWREVAGTSLADLPPVSAG